MEKGYDSVARKVPQRSGMTVTLECGGRSGGAARVLSTAAPAERSRPPRQPDIAARLAALAADLLKLQRTVSTVEERLDSILLDLEKLLGSLAGASPMLAARAARRADRSSDELLRAAAQKGANAVRLRRLGAGAELRIDEGRRVPITLAMADLVETLLTDRPGGDRLVGWKPFADIEAALAKRAGRAVSRAAVKNLIYRLRERLRRAGENPFLVQVWKGRGARFALRRAVGQGDAQAEREGCDDA
jgi:hypothetical protein